MRNVRTAKGEILNFEELIIKQTIAESAGKPSETIAQQIKQNPSGLTMDMFSKIGTTGVTITKDDASSVLKDTAPNGLVDVQTKRKINQPITE